MCGQKGIRHAIVQTSGFQELGGEGDRLATEVSAVAHRWGIRFTGPNGLGVIHPKHGFVPIFVPLRPQWRPGGISIASQSGGMGFTYLFGLGDQNVGVSKFVSVGNKMDLDEVDYVNYFAKDHATDAIVLYLEGISRGRDLFDALRNCDKPVLVHKSGRTEAGTSMAFSHTAALTANDAVLDAMLTQAGAVRVFSTQEVVSRCKAFELPPLRGDRVAVISRSGGHAVVSADASDENGFTLPPFSDEFLQAASGRQVMKKGNPLDMGDVFDFDLYARLLEMVAKDPSFDAIMLLFGYFPPFETTGARKLLPWTWELSRKYDKPVVITLIADEQELNDVRRTQTLPYFVSVEEAFAALRLRRHATLRRELMAIPKEATAKPDVKAAKDLIAGKFDAGHDAGQPATLDMVTAFDALAKAGLPTVKTTLVRTVADLFAIVEFPVAAKIASAKAIHKSDVGGVILGVRDRDGLHRAFSTLADRFGPFGDGEGVVVQPMAQPGVEVIVGARRDPVFGPIVVVGLGGIMVELLKDTAIAMAPITHDEAVELIRKLRGHAIFDGIRGKPPVDIKALAEIVTRVSHLVTETPEIGEMDCNPVLVHENGATIVDVRIQELGRTAI